MSFTNISTGQTHSVGGIYLEVKENECLAITGQVDDPGLPGTMRNTVRLVRTFVGTALHIVQGIPGMIPADVIRRRMIG